MDEKNTLQTQIIAMSNTLVAKATRFTADTQKLFYVALASINYGVNENNEVEIDKEELFQLLDITNSHRHADLRKNLEKLVFSSFVKFGDGEIFRDGFLLTGYHTTRKKAYIQIHSYFLPLVKELAGNYTRLLNDDVVSFDSKFSMMLYQLLMKNNDYRDTKLTTKELKELFGLSVDDYVYDGKFNRTLFEKKTVNFAVDEINKKSRCISNLKYEKVKRPTGQRIAYYHFTFDWTDPSRAAKDLREKIARGQTSIYDFSADSKYPDKRVRDVDDAVVFFDWMNS